MMYIFSDIDKFISIEQTNGVAYILYNKSEKRYIAMLDMHTLTLVKNSELILPELPE